MSNVPPPGDPASRDPAGNDPANNDPANNDPANKDPAAGTKDVPPAEDPRKTSDRLGAYRRPTMDFEREASIGGGAMAWAAVGIEFGLYVVLFFLGGKWLDGKFGWDPWGAAMGGLLGALMGMFALIRRVMRTSDDDAGPGGSEGGTTGA